jgi:AraC family transcriptional regulator
MRIGIRRLDIMKAQTVESYQERILRALVFVQQNLDEPISLGKLAEVAHFSPFHFHRIFRGMVGESVKEHVRRLRLERAAGRLKTTGAPVIDIALDAGYETHESFTRAFTGMFGLPPSRYRGEHAATALGEAPSGVHFTPNGRPAFHPAHERRMNMNVEIKRIEKLRVAFVRHTGPYNEVGTAWNTLCGWAGPKGLLAPGARLLGVSHDDPEITPPERLRYDAAVVVPESTGPEGEVGIQEVGQGDYATTIHRGPYENLSQTYAAICGEWAPASGREIASGPAIEFYLNSPDNTPPEALETEVCLPLA